MCVVRWSFLLVALLVLQTAGALYDSHEALQAVSGHFSLHHLDPVDGPGESPADQPGSAYTHAELEGMSAAGEPDLSAPLLDFCNHCCHCHGSSFTGLLGQSFLPIRRGGIIYRELAHVAVPSGYFAPLLRPPITQV
ncbi:hypothetical protein [uncultured Microbulbifer sp.]|uniref:hypothetical protein n=1 Tax=uncultured Microbulbifer sp. TaxID=348147 RepID=UPI00262BFC45|nr:hypothetical protein [uncultured Microbulbifer sp.]